MLTVDGERLANMVLAGEDSSLATHIALGYNVVPTNFFLSPMGDISNKYSSLYIVDEVPIKNKAVITLGSERDQIVFAAESTTYKKYIANHIALIKRFAGNFEREQKIIAPADSPDWDTNSIHRYEYLFTESGGRENTVGNAWTTSFITSLSFEKYSGDDFISFPFIFDSTVGSTYQSAHNSNVSITLYIHNPNYPNEAERVLSASNTVTANLGGGSNRVGLSGEAHLFNTILHGAHPTNRYNILPFLFHAQLKDFTGPVATYRELFESKIVRMQVTGHIAFGSICITPWYMSDDSITTVAFRKLNAPVIKTGNETMTNIEYRIGGITRY